MNTKMIRRCALASALVLLTVSCKTEIPIPVDPPVARKDYAQTAVDTPVTLAPLLNDHDPNGEVLSLVAIGAAAHGTATIGAGGTIDYTPSTGYVGGDSFSVTIADASGNEVTEMAYVSVGSSTRIIYRSNHEDYFTNQVYVTDFNFPGVAIPVNQYLRITEGPVPSESNVEVYSLSPDRTHVTLLADDSDESNARNVFVVAIDQLGVATQVTDIDIGQATSAVHVPRLTADNAYVLYVSNEFQPLLNEIAMVEVANTANLVRINQAFVTGQSLLRFELTPDGTRVLYVTNDVATGFNRLYSVELANPGVATLLSGTPTAGSTGLFEFALTGGIGFAFVPGTTKVVYAAAENGSTFAELWMVDYAAPAAPVKVSGTPLASGVVSFQISGDGTRVVYNSFEDSTTQLELYMGSLTAPGTTVRLSAPQTGDHSVASYAMGQDSTYVVYLSDLLTANVQEAFRVDFSNPGVAVRLNAPLATGGDVLTLGVSAADPRALLYVTNPDTESPLTQAIYLMDVDSPEVSTETGERVLLLGTLQPAFTPDGEAVIYNADPDQQGISAVFGYWLSDPTQVIKFTAERFGGAAATAVRFLP